MFGDLVADHRRPLAEHHTLGDPHRPAAFLCQLTSGLTPTVQQPNSLAFDETSDTLYVVSGSGAGVQVIEHAAGTR